MSYCTPAVVRVCRLAAGEADRWAEAVGGAADAGLPHAPEWLSIVPEAYGHEPLYLLAEDDAGARALLPAFVVRRPLVGPVVASMPFLDGGGPCGAPAPLVEMLVGRLVDEARLAGASLVEIRCGRPLPASAGSPEQHKVNLTLPLAGGADALWRRLDGSVRNQIRKAERSGLRVEIGGPGALDEFYAVFAARMRDLGSPVHGRRFFAAVLDRFGARAQVRLVRRGGATVGGLVALAWNGTVTVPWASCLPEYFALCPNMLLYWETIRAASDGGSRQFDFGRSTRGSGTYRFKRQWGAQEEPLYWYRMPPSNGRRAAPAAAGASLLGAAWRRLPLAITRHLGPPLRKYLTQ